MTHENTFENGAELTRAVVVDISAATKDDRLVKLSFSSEEPVMRVFDFGAGWEILGHGPGEVNLTRLAAGNAPLLKDHRHDLDAMIGTVERAWIEGGKGQALVRFADTAEGSEMLARVRAGEVKSVSVGYRVLEHARVDDRDGLPTVRVRWMPYEISLVAVPADALVGVGRSMPPAISTQHQRKERDMTSPITTENVGDNAQNAITLERARASEITIIGQRFELDQSTVSNAIAEGTPIDKFRSQVMDYLDNSNSAEPSNVRATLGVLRRSQDRPYSLTRAIAAELSGNWKEAGFERECAEELARSTGRSPTGIYVPAVALAGRDLLTTGNAGSLIGTEHMASQFIDALRPEVQVMQLGARVLPGLRENVSIPRMPAGTSAEWIAEDAAATESTPGFDSVSLTLKQLSARTRMSRRQIKQALPALDAVLQNDLRREIAIAVDRAAIAGVGSALEPEGILNTTGIGTLPADGADGRTIDWSHVTDLMAQVEDAGAPMQSLAFLSNPKVKAKLLSTPKFAGGDSAILTTSGSTLSIAGHTAAFTSLVPSNFTMGSGTDLSALIFGAWSELLIGQWGGIDVIVDDKTESDRGNVRITAHSEWDIALRNAQSFAAITDIEAG
ncbi:phage major capsid protein [uncultured Tateyamaria sp.]|uniref:phage major capsid protein n=1 Tax=uncultured Tateyamaria sp. TaxID=455651 RepID=UPI0026301075|nr:phage major capsid protein [uncultured Tateyamaria sp.]